MRQIATYGMLCIIGCALTDIANATRLEECRAKKHNVPIEERLECYENLDVSPQRESITQPTSESQHDKASISGVNDVVASKEEKKSEKKDCVAANADCKQSKQRNASPVLLEAHEPNRVGATWDSDDVRFMDFTLSIQHPIAHDIFVEKWPHWLPYFAFTGRFGQYIGTRPSSPVIAKRFNPKIFFRHFLNGCTIKNKDDRGVDYYDIEYAHISNGQSIDSLQSFNVHAADLGNTEYAKDYISRGWDYFGITGKTHPDWAKELTVQYGFKHYIGGLMQNKVEQYFPWEETRSITKLSQVSGLHLAGKRYIDQYWINDFTVSIDTGRIQE